jgi:hypothetical protein
MSLYISITFQTVATDNVGNHTVTTSAQIPRCIFAPGLATENLVNEDQVKDAGTLYCPYGTDPTAYDRALLPDGSVWELEGNPNDWANPFTSALAGTVVNLKRVTG